MSAAIPISTLDKFTTFGDLLRFLRRRAGITQVDLALAVGYSNAQISRLEQNLRPPDPTTIEARFVPALGLEQEPHAVARLLELAANVRREDAPSAGLCPYKGLSYFDEVDADLFVGRETLTAALTGRVLAMTSNDEAGSVRLLAIVGASGSGKSSLVRAGLVPALRWHPAAAGWPSYLLTPTAHPIESLAMGLLAEAESVTTVARLADDLKSDPRCLHISCVRAARAAGVPHVLLVIDQFEELFSLCRDETERQAFIASLLGAASAAQGPAVVILTLRADFYPHCAAYPDLRAALARHQEYIGALSDQELRRAIEEPARRGRWDLEPGLVDLLVHDVGHEPGALPLLSHALLETWQRRRGRTLTLGGYAASGGVRGAIAETAQAVFTDRLTPEQQVLARRVFLHLTELGDESGTGDTRRRATFDELIVEPGAADATRLVLTALADSRLITITGNAVEVAHEALIREWPTLRGWLEEDREGLRLHRHLSDTARDWAAMNRENDALYRGARLAQAREWVALNAGELNPLEREFLETSVEAADREAAEREAQRQNELAAAQRLAEAERHRAEDQERASKGLRMRNRIISGVGVVALLLATLAGVFGWQSTQNMRRAEENADLAEANLVRAKSLGLAISSDVLLSYEGNPQTAALLAIRSLQQSYSPEADALLLRALDRLYLRQSYTGHSSWIYSLTVSPDGRYLLTGSNDGTARLWDLLDGKEVRRFPEENGGIAAVAFSPDGRFIATGSNAGIVRIWDANTGAQVRSLAGHSAGITSVAFSPDGHTLVSASGDKTARLWEAASGQLLRTFTGHTALVTAAVFSTDGKYILTGSADGTARIWDVSTADVIRTFAPSSGQSYAVEVTGVAFSPDGQAVLIGRAGGASGLWNTQSGGQICMLGDGSSGANAVAFSPDGKYVLTGSADGVARLWSSADCHKVRQSIDLILGLGGVETVAFSPDGSYFVTGGFDDTARLWTTPESPPVHTLLPREQNAAWSSVPAAHALTSVTVSQDGRYLLAGSVDQTAHLWDLQSGTELRTLAGHTGAVNGVALSGDGKSAITGDDDGTIRVWEVRTGRLLRAIDAGMRHVTGVALSADGRYIFATGTDALVAGGGEPLGEQPPAAMSTRFWDARTGRLIHAFDFGYSSTLGSGVKPGIAVSSDGKRVLVRNLGTGALLFDMLSGEGLCDFSPPEGEITGVALSADGKYALTGGTDKTARLWDVSTCQQVRVFTDKTGTVLSVAFSPDGKYALTGQDDNTARLWDLSTGVQLRQFTAHTGAVNAVVFSPDGRDIFTAGQDGTVRLWSTDYHDALRFACSMLWRDLTQEERSQYGIADAVATCQQP